MLLDDLSVLIEPENIIIKLHYKESYSLDVRINEKLFKEIVDGLMELLNHEETNLARYYYIEKTNTGVFFGIDKVKVNGKIFKYEYIRVESYSNMEIIKDDSSSENPPRLKYVTHIIEGGININDILEEIKYHYGYIINK